MCYLYLVHLNAAFSWVLCCACWLQPFPSLFCGFSSFYFTTPLLHRRLPLSVLFISSFSLSTLHFFHGNLLSIFFFLERSARKPQLFAAQASSHTRYLKSKNIIVLEHIIPFLCKMPVLFTRKYLILVFHSTKSPLFIFSKVFESANLPCADFYTSV